MNERDTELNQYNSSWNEYLEIVELNEQKEIHQLVHSLLYE